MSGITCLYIGKTKMTLHRRSQFHTYNNNKTHSKYIPKNIEWSIELIEECDNNIASLREQYYYDLLKPLYNKCRPGNTKSESNKYYQRKNREHLTNYMKEYRLKNKNTK